MHYFRIYNKRGGASRSLKTGGGQNIKRSVGTKYKRKETKIGLSLLTPLNIGISGILPSRLQ